MHPEVIKPGPGKCPICGMDLVPVEQTEKIRPVMSISIMKLWQRMHIRGVKNSDPKDVVGIIAFAKATYSKMIQNLICAVGYNLIAILLADGILYPKFILSPAMRAVLMSLSTIIVAFNAQLLRKQFK